MNNLDPEVRKFLLYTVSETFAEIRKFVEFKQYDRQKVLSGIQELSALFNLQEDIKPIVHGDYLSCVKCSRKKNKRLSSPYCWKCQLKEAKYETQKR
jgi:hypothetical protein